MPDVRLRKMTHREFTDLLNSDSPYDSLCSIGDALVTKVITDDDAYWAASIDARILYGLCCVLHHAGANGLDALWHYNEGSQVAILSSAIEGLKQIGERELYSCAAEFWNVVASAIAAKNEPVPEFFSDGDRTAFDHAQYVVDSLDHDPILQEADRLEGASNSFISCWDSSFPRSVIEWLKYRSEHFAGILCETTETGEQDSRGNGGQRG